MIAQNKSRLLPEDFQEAVKVIRSGVWKWMICLLAVSVVTASLLLYYYQGLLGTHSFWPLWGILAGCLILVYNFLIYPRIAGKNFFLKTASEFSQEKNKELILKFSVWEDRVEVSAKHGKQLILNFRDLKKWVLTDSILILIFADRSIIMHPDSFTDGDLQSLIQMIDKG